MKPAYLVEGIGTFFLVLVVALSGNPIAIGAILLAMVYMGGHVSGGHFNPAVSLAVFIRGKLDQNSTINYILYQTVGGFIAAIVVLLIRGTAFVPTVPVGFDPLSVLLTEAVFTYVLAMVVLHVATAKKQEANHFYGIAIGFTLMAIAFAGGPISGGVFNPAVAIGPVLVDIGNIDTSFVSLFLYILGPLLGGYVAGATFKYTNPPEKV